MDGIVNIKLYKTVIINQLHINLADILNVNYLLLDDVLFPFDIFYLDPINKYSK